MTRENDEMDGSNRVSRRETLNCLSEDGTEQGNGGSDRRSVLRGAAASAVATLGFTNVAAAIESPEARKLRRMENELNRFKEQTYRQYDDETSVREAIQEHGGEVLKLLAERGYIQEPSVSEFTDASIEVDAVYESHEETVSSYLRIETEVEDGQLGLNVYPETGTQYAVLSDPETETAAVIDPKTDSYEPEDTYVMACLGANCACDEYYVRCQANGYCYRDGKTGNSCCDCGSLNCNYICP